MTPFWYWVGGGRRQFHPRGIVISGAASVGWPRVRETPVDEQHLVLRERLAWGALLWALCLGVDATSCDPLERPRPRWQVGKEMPRGNVQEERGPSSCRAWAVTSSSSVLGLLRGTPSSFQLAARGPCSFGIPHQAPAWTASLPGATAAHSGALSLRNTFSMLL